jgi:hypothetical protein
MNVDAYDADNRAFQAAHNATVQHENEPDVARSLKADDFWKLGSQEGKPLDSFFLERRHLRELNDPDFRGFNRLIRTYFAELYPEDPVSGSENIKVPFSSLLIMNFAYTFFTPSRSPSTRHCIYAISRKKTGAAPRTFCDAILATTAGHALTRSCYIPQTRTSGSLA